jgi:hypothetical protein
MQERVTASLAKPRLYAVLLTGFATSALAIAGVGLFGVLSCASPSEGARSPFGPHWARNCAPS